MPLPSYMTDNPQITPLKALENRLRRTGQNLRVRRQGCVVHIEGVCADDGRQTVRKALSIACQHADGHRLTLEAAIPAVDGDIVDDFESNGFRIVSEADEEDEAGAHYVLRRAAA